MDSEDSADPKILTVLDALTHIKHAWNCVSAATISNCFRHCGFASTTAPELESESPDVDPNDMLQDLGVHCDDMDACADSEDAELETVAPTTDDEIVAAVQQADTTETPEDNEDNNDADPPAPMPTAAQMRGAFDVLQRFFQGFPNQESTLNTLSAMHMRGDKLQQSRKVQKSIKDFFSACG